MTHGQPLKTLHKDPFTVEQLKAYADASWDNNLIHLDDAFAKAAGFPSVIVHGMLSMAYLAELVELNFPRDQFVIKKFSTRFRRVTFPGDQLLCGGEFHPTSDPLCFTLTLWGKNQKGELTVDGQAEVKKIH
jgi:acyl dehydratase